MAESKATTPGKVPASPATPGGLHAAAVKKSVSAIVAEWAETLRPQNAPDQRHMGPLAWVRGEKVKELIAALEAAGYK